MPLVKEQERYTCADYLEWDDAERYELIEGEAYMMSSPSRLHQEISGSLFGTLWNFLKGKPCKVYAAPFSVRLYPQADLRDDTIVQPDIAVICDPAKLDDRGCNGAPDLVIEILSPSTVRRDQVLKFHQYREAGVREYWILSPEEKVLQVYILENGRYTAHAYEDTATVPVAVLPGCEIDLTTIFPQP